MNNNKRITIDYLKSSADPVARIWRAMRDAGPAGLFASDLDAVIGRDAGNYRMTLRRSGWCVPGLKRLPPGGRKIDFTWVALAEQAVVAERAHGKRGRTLRRTATNEVSQLRVLAKRARRLLPFQMARAMEEIEKRLEVLELTMIEQESARRSEILQGKKRR